MLTIMETSKKDILNFFSNVKYNYYNLEMAIIISFYEKNFTLMTQKEILNSIISKKDYKEKMRKSNGENYQKINSEIKKILKGKEQIFRQKKYRNEQKYSIILSNIKNFWNSNAATMNKIEDKKEENDINSKSSKKMKSKKSFIEDKDEYKNEKNKKNKKRKKDDTIELLSRKTKRKKYKYEENTNKDSTPIKNLFNFKIENKKVKQKMNENKINGYLTDDFSSSKDNLNESDIENLLKDMFSNSIYDKFPKTDENSLNNIIDNVNNLLDKLSEIKNNLLDLQTLKLAEKYKIDNEKEKKSEQDKKNNIINYYKEIQKLLNKNQFNSDAYERQTDLFKKSINDFLESYEDSYDNIFKIVCDKNGNMDYILYKKDEDIKEFNGCYENIKNFIKENKKGINDTNNFLKNYSRNYYKKKFDKVIKFLDTKKNENKNLKIKETFEIYNVKEEEKEHKIENKKKNKAKTNKNIPKSPSIKKEVNKFSDINSEINESIYGCEDIKKIKIKEESVANTDEYSLISEINSEIKSFDLKSPNSYGINDENDSDSEKSKLTATFFSNTNTTDKHEN